jgi:hypothetical protein
MTSGNSQVSMVSNFFSSSLTKKPNKLQPFVLGKPFQPFQPGLIFDVRAYPRVEHLKGDSLG